MLYVAGPLSVHSHRRRWHPVHALFITGALQHTFAVIDIAHLLRQVEAYMATAFGSRRFASMSEALARPSTRPCLRANTLRTTAKQVASKLRELRGTQGGVISAAPHPIVPSAVIIQGGGPHAIDYEPCGKPQWQPFENMCCFEPFFVVADANQPAEASALRRADQTTGDKGGSVLCGC